jgi:predicted nucleic acid-binding protein
MIVLDTDVLSELMRPTPAETVLAWLARQPAPRMFTTTVTQAEIGYGLALMSPGKRRADLEAAVEQMFATDFLGRVLPFDAAAADEFPTIAARRKQTGQPVAAFDVMIAAIARSRGAAVATRNVRDFEGSVVTVIDPWRG